MTVLLILQAAAFALLVLGGLARFMPDRIPFIAAPIALLATLLALAGPPATVEAGLSFRLDGLAAIALASTLLPGLFTASPLRQGALMLAILAGDAIGLTLALFVATLVPPPSLGQGGAGGGFEPPEDAPQPPTTNLRTALPGLAALLLVLFLLTWPTLSLTAPATLLPWQSALLLPAALAAALLLPGPVGLYVLARALLDLPGPATPLWWGPPVILAGAGLAVFGARRAAATGRLDHAATAAGQAAQGIALLGLGATLFARGADLPALAGFAATGALFTLLAWALWGGILGTASYWVQQTAGPPILARLGGLLRRAPVTGLALAAALATLGLAPLSPAFAGAWMTAQSVLGAARAGGVAGVLLAALTAGALGLATALLAVSAVRLAGSVLLGTPRTARAAAITEPHPAIRALLAALALASLAIGVLPWLGLALVRPGAQILARPLPAPALLSLASSPDAPGYAAPVLAILLLLGLLVTALAAQGPLTTAPPWTGGFADAGEARGNTAPLLLFPAWRSWRPALPRSAGLVALSLLLAAVIGWAAR